MTLLTVLLLFFFGADVAVVPKPQGEDLDDQTTKRISSDSPFSKRPPPSLFGTVSSAGERIHQSCSNPVSVLSLDIVGSHRVRQIPNSPIRGNQAELKATTEEERMDYFYKARPPNFFSPPLFRFSWNPSNLGSWCRRSGRVATRGFLLNPRSLLSQVHVTQKSYFTRERERCCYYSSCCEKEIKAPGPPPPPPRI